MRTDMSSGSALVPALWPSSVHPWIRNVILVLVGTGILTLSAKINVLTQPVPITLQTFAIMAIAAAYGRWLAVATVLAYLAEGFAGLPVFASPVAAGPAYFIGTTGGFLIGFIAIAYVVGWAADRGWDRSPIKLGAAMIVGDAIAFALGFLWLAWFATLSSGATGGIGAASAFEFGIQPFILPDLVKIALAALFIPAAWRAAGRAGIKRLNAPTLPWTLPQRVRATGVGLLLISFVWWIALIVQTEGAAPASSIVCLAFTTATCSILNLGVELQGGIGYYPFLFWIGLCCIVAAPFLSKSKDS